MMNPVTRNLLSIGEAVTIERHGHEDREDKKTMKRKGKKTKKKKKQGRWRMGMGAEGSIEKKIREWWSLL